MVTTLYNLFFPLSGELLLARLFCVDEARLGDLEKCQPAKLTNLEMTK